MFIYANGRTAFGKDRNRLRDIPSSPIVVLIPEKDLTLVRYLVSSFPGSSVVADLGDVACGKTFTRSDAMNKHLRSLHGIITEPPNKKKPKDPPSALTQRPLPAAEQAEWMRSNDLDLIEDEEVAEVLPRVRRREMFWTTSEDDERLVKMVRDRYPRGLGKLKGRAEDGSEDSFDEGVGGRCDLGPKVENLMTDPEDGKEVELMTRPGWQIKFIMAKAKLMLVEEENAMRRRELAELMVLERKMQTGEV